ASFMVVKVCGCGPASTVSGCRFTGLMIIVAVPDSAVFCVEVAVIVTDVGPETTGAVKVPLVLIEPALAFQVTLVVKLPVPVTVAKHPIIWLDWMGDGKQLAVTPVTVNALLLEPQAANHNTLPTTSNSLNLHILLVSLTDVAGRHPLRYQLRNVSLAMKTSWMSGLLDHQARRLDGDGRSTVPLLFL